MYITLRLRMILLFCVVIGVFLAGTYVVVYDSFAHEVRLGLDDRLLDAARPLIAAIAAHPTQQHLAGLEIDGQTLQLLAPGGRIVEQSKGSDEIRINAEDLRQAPTPAFQPANPRL